MCCIDLGRDYDSGWLNSKVTHVKSLEIVVRRSILREVDVLFLFFFFFFCFFFVFFFFFKQKTAYEMPK